MITIHMLPALYGDTICVEIQNGSDVTDQTTLLIDCSFNYSTNILPLLEQLNKDDKIIDRFIISHFDDDHIRSAAKFIKANGKPDAPQIIPVSDVWLNTYRHLQFSKKQHEKPDEEQVKLLKTYIKINSNIDDNTPGEVGAAQASILGKELYSSGCQWNGDFDGGPVCIETKQTVKIKENVIITLLSPTRKLLADLESLFEIDLKRLKVKLSDTELIDDAFELFMIQQGKEKKQGYIGPVSAPNTITPAAIRKLSQNKYSPDDAAGNASSIAFIMEADNKRTLFLADAHAETIIEQLEKLFPDETDHPIFFDAVKIAHHGSFRNNSPRLFELIDSPNFLISTNGGHPSHDHPDAETLALIINRPISERIEKRNLIFNYYPSHLKGFFEEAIMAEFNCSAVVLQKIELK
jgi:beta-lactamase superfamily II metal-dependent hydrolase